MCVDCLKERCPDRDTVCLDNGSYLMNYAGCKECKSLDVIKITNRVTSEDEDGEEVITYQHVCQNCNHLIANHEYTFRLDDDFQVYQMYCMLCGHSDDERSILPNDPRAERLFF
ncbi:hypothetical protein ScPMuIL_014227 [Solemya velum]